MKKKLVASLAAAMVLGVAGTSFAAANPFVDVPAKHWAYASVTSLAQAGIVDGYGDGKFQGDKMLSRYEMAQVVAKAMAKSDKADATQKAAIDKLAAEFAEELNVIGVRVGALEKNASNLKFTGNLRVRWNNTPNKTDSQQFKDRFFLNMTSQINDKTSLYARFVFQDDKFNQETAQRLSDMALTTKGLISNTDVTVGRYSLNLGATNYFAGSTGDVDGIMTNTKDGNFGLMLGYGQMRNNGAVINDIRNGMTIKNFDFAEATYVIGKAKINASYLKNLNQGATAGSTFVAPVTDIVKDAYDISGGGLTYTFSSTVKAMAEYYKNTASGAKLGNGNAPVAFMSRIQYKGANSANPGSFGFLVEYNKFQGDVFPYALAGNFAKVSYGDINGTANGIKWYLAQFDYTLAKNVSFNGIYQFNIKDAVTGANNSSTSFSRAQVTYFF